MRELDRNRRKPVRKDGLNVTLFQILFKRTKAFGGEIGTQKLGICRNARVCDVVVGTEWRFRSTRDRTLQLHILKSLGYRDTN
ncbi:unnamed protein product [Brassica rapa]|uniref:Uncharacterized protein n=1 Tax=Brassica campestris TaxID=3711 RepID=A0A8D9HLG6_BRACM|nr:unnamed protein product [Brassica rapa]